MGKYASRYNDNQTAEVATPIVNESRKQKPLVAEEVTERQAKPVSSKVDKRLKDFETVAKTARLVKTVVNEAELSFKKQQLEGSISMKLSWGMYLSDLIYQDTHNGEHLFDYSTGELIQEID